jgi:hypothetical protein
VLSQVKIFDARGNPNYPIVSNINTYSTDPYQIRDIQGLGPVAAEMGIEPYGMMDGSQLTSTRVGVRNIVFKFGFNPDYATGDTVTALRKTLYLRGMTPGRKLDLEFTDLEIASSKLMITGYVETVEPNIFSDTPEVTVSILCPDPYFTEYTAQSLNGDMLSSLSAQSPFTTIDYTGTAPCGFRLEVSRATTSTSTAKIETQFITRGWSVSEHYEIFKGDFVLNQTEGFYLNTTPGGRYVKRFASGVSYSTSLLGNVADDSSWPMLYPGYNQMFGRCDGISTADWYVVYNRRHGGL